MLPQPSGRSPLQTFTPPAACAATDSQTESQDTTPARPPAAHSAHRLLCPRARLPGSSSSLGGREGAGGGRTVCKPRASSVTYLP